MQVSINIADRDGVRLIQTIETWRGGESWGLRFAVITFIGRGGLQIGLEMPIGVNTGGRAMVTD